jgi:hypothetical protein
VKVVVTSFTPHGVKEDRRIIATTIIDWKTAVDQLTWQLRGRLLESNINDSRDASIERSTKNAQTDSI